MKQILFVFYEVDINFCLYFDSQDDKMREFFVALALCHTVQADEVEPAPYDKVDGADDSTGPVTTFTYQVGW